MTIYKRCSRCGKRLLTGTECSCKSNRHKEYDRFSRDKKSKRFYDSKEWEVARMKALELDEGIDVYMYMTEREIVNADTVHHVIPLRECWEKRNDVDNLMSLNSDTHSVIEKMYKKDKLGMQEKLEKMLKEYRNMRGGAV